MKESKSIGWLELAVGIVFLISAFVSFTNPENTLEAFVILFGIAAIMKGIGTFVGYTKLKSMTGLGTSLVLISAVLDVILGILFLTNLASGAITLALLFALWFILDSFVGLMNLSYVKEASTGLYWVYLILNIFSLIIGFMMLFNPMISLVTISMLAGIYFTVFGIQFIILAFNRI
ncbi:uncharacterized membrane protein HdeD (DUF308 family) [Breznakia sp. PF5-3]|uniref:HdeD family acid-resistance protein n=1 Tax=unclassified Breznakia TaxID=2623764 RepID=UPI002405C536|nr:MULTISPECIES: DUF308 domain-containing protein [unclassified Breznakia]MDL2276227.1 DUF308 domain-containing protein [Breznakia sp. OttesenSCG-928-G09]MDF9824885.1 uncharacterized membrane protein HdeD (DUF308 family) [Breznakia sp. PM6-1]MDF9835616.1 uncharacterized membrane protein HdeD (DUF308 family) [Breznakia sp. PF5-3]MDF9837968.1 uncharacterized membrane protein HdeD (DUF308 family) [Breznakia sp. PFB2-8]MDF9859957.1 uncharacterized membrane protein HdeD (DUF308 family) [Breznakia s